MTYENHERRIAQLELMLESLIAFIKKSSVDQMKVQIGMMESSLKQEESYSSIFEMLASSLPETIHTKLQVLLNRSTSQREQLAGAIDLLNKKICDAGEPAPTEPPSGS